MFAHVFDCRINSILKEIDENLSFTFIEGDQLSFYYKDELINGDSKLSDSILAELRELASYQINVETLQLNRPIEDFEHEYPYEYELFTSLKDHLGDNPYLAYVPMSDPKMDCIYLKTDGQFIERVTQANFLSVINCLYRLTGLTNEELLPIVKQFRHEFSLFEPLINNIPIEDAYSFSVEDDMFFEGYLPIKSKTLEDSDTYSFLSRYQDQVKYLLNFKYRPFDKTYTIDGYHYKPIDQIAFEDLAFIDSSELDKVIKAFDNPILLAPSDVILFQSDNYTMAIVNDFLVDVTREDLLVDCISTVDMNMKEADYVINTVKERL